MNGPMKDLPQRVLDDPIARAWAEAHDTADPAFRWEPGHVDERLVEAGRLMERVVRSDTPGLSRYWPGIVRYFDAVSTLAKQGYEDDSYPADPDDIPPTPRRVRPDEISAMMEAIDWPIRYIDGDPRAEQMRRVLMLWIRCKALRRPFGKEIRKAGLVYATAKRRRWQASLLIATGLIRDQVLAPETVEMGLAADPVSARPIQPRQIQTDPDLEIVERVLALPEVRRAPDARDMDRRVFEAIRGHVLQEFSGRSLGKRNLRLISSRIGTLYSKARGVRKST